MSLQISLKLKRKHTSNYQKLWNPILKHTFDHQHEPEKNKFGMLIIYLIIKSFFKEDSFNSHFALKAILFSRINFQII